MPKGSTNYGERMARIETTLDFMKTEIGSINSKLDAFIAAHDTKNDEQKKEFDARYASKRIETAFWGIASFLGLTFLSALVYVIAVYPQALKGG